MTWSPPRRWCLALACTLGATLATLPALSPGAAPVDPAAAIEQQLRSGQYEKARRAADLLSRRPATGARGLLARRAVVLAARAEVALGQLAPARRRLEQAMIAVPEDLPLRAELTRVAAALGDRGAVKDLAQRSFDDWEDGRVDRKDPQQLTAMAVIVRHDENWEDANSSLRAALKLDRKAIAANLVWGDLLLEKHSASEADACFREVLAIDPNHPDALVGRARVLLERGYDGRAAEQQIGAALAVNPRHAQALALRGEIALDGEDWPAVNKVVTALRRTNPEDPGAAWLAASLALLRDQRASYEAERDRRLEVRPADGDFFVQVAEALVRHRRYEQAKEVAADGAERDAAHPRLLASLGNTLLRLGEETEGVALLRRAFERDGYDVRTYNLLQLFEKVIPAKYVTISTPHLRFRVEATQRRVIETMVAPFLEQTFDRYATRYGFTPPQPVMFELYGAVEHYAVRTVGLPRLGLAGVCFGRVITSQAPSNGAFNWGMVLAHELAHVFSLQLSKSRVPRWFTEGLAERETARLRPDWKRQMDLELGAVLEADGLQPLGALSQAFLRAGSDRAAALAYMHAAAAVEFLERQFGFPKLRAALAAWGQGRPDAEVLEAVAGMPLHRLEQAFEDDLRARLLGPSKRFLPALAAFHAPAVDSSDPEPRSGRGWAERGLRHLASRDLRAAADDLVHARRAAAGRDEAVIDFFDGALALEQNRPLEARWKLEPLRKRGIVSYDIELRLGLAALALREADLARTHLEAAVNLAPASVEARALLAEHLGALERDQERLALETEIFRLEPQTASLAKRVVLEQARAGRSALAAELASAALFIDPDDPDLHAARGRALLALGKLAEGAAGLEQALTMQPEDPRPLHRLLVGAYQKLGDPARAAQHQRKAGAAE